MTDRRYSREEVDAILGRAIERDRSVDGLSHEELLAVGSEVGVSAESLQRAATEIVREKQEQVDLAQMRNDALRGFFAHLIPYVCVNAILVVINYATTHFPWALIPILGWGIGLLSHLVAVLFPSRERLERRIVREKEKQRRRELKREVKASAKQFEQAVGQGVAALLKIAAEKVAESADSVGRKPETRVRIDPQPPSPYDKSEEPVPPSERGSFKRRS